MIKSMLLTSSRIRQHIDLVTSDFRERIQRLENDQAELRSHIEGERQLQILVANISAAGQGASMIGSAFENFAMTMRAPLPRGRAGGLARARKAWRYFDGTFMPESEKAEAYRAEYERYAAGGRLRARTALRADNGTFLPR
jgi:hypothetical protein